MNRPQLALMMSFVRKGDTVICHSMDRLGRNLDDLRKMVLDLAARGVHVKFVKEMRASPGMSRVRLKIAAWPLRRARITSKPAIVA